MADEATDHEVEGWAAREKKRREDWLAGPTEAEKLEWRRRQRRLRESRELYDELDEREFALERRLERDAYLAGAGAFDWLVHLPPRLAAKLIRSGLDAQYDYYTEPVSRRRVPPDSSSEA